MSAPLVNVRGQPLSDGSFVCVLAFLGFGESGSDCCALALLESRENRKIRAHMTDDAAPVAGLRICMIRPPAHCWRNELVARSAAAAELPPPKRIFLLHTMDNTMPRNSGQLRDI